VKKSRKELVLDAAVKALKPYLDFLRDYDRGIVTNEDLHRIGKTESQRLSKELSK